MPVRMALALPSRKTLLFIALCLLWYSTSFLSASTSKALLSPNKVKKIVPLLASGLQNGSLDPNVAANGGSAAGSSSSSSSTPGVSKVKTPPLFPYPVSLTALQFFFVFSFSYLLSSPTIAAFLYARLRLSPPKDAVTGRPRGLMGTLVMVNAAKLREMVGLSVFNVTGHAMTSAAIQMVPVSTVHTVKALSPLFTVLTYVFLLRLSYPLRTYLSLLPLTLGVIFACSGLSSIEGPNVVPGLALSVGSTIVFVAQNLWSKKLLGHALAGGSSSSERRVSQGNQVVVKLDKLNILFWSSGVSCLVMVPVVLLSDMPRMMAARSARLAMQGLSGTAATLAGGWEHTDPSIPPSSSFPPLNPMDTSSHASRIASLLFSNGIVHFSQNLLAFSVLGLTSPVTYSIASLFKRVFVICFAILWFGQTVTRLQWAGIVLTFIGLYLYNDSKVRTGSEGGDGGKGAKGAMLGDAQSVASREEDAAMDFGMDKGSRRRAGLLPMSGGVDQSVNGRAAPPAASGPGPIWKGMSSTTLYGGSGPSNRSAAPGGLPSRSISINGYGPANGHGNGYANGHGSSNGYGRPPAHDSKSQTKRD
ncbi:TPT-domain-containing protein [Microstroma glucosiphilum]|uniref:TPT-domain-containing protein n=1 Tax=Pseudomicrostroma glucosiphilum TaxID=1684307 RepID=A0A316U7D2_9BASI|nr:TPT-domain-containing protein [Pseudomicrostroma glucosiphilum]PWN20764.1 TPT-domain-containing protein [Pseudomicrostroma glucosiphilum]